MSQTSIGREIQVVKPTQQWTGVMLFSTARFGGVSHAPFDSLNLGLGSGDDVDKVAANRDLLRVLIPSNPYWLKQVHGDVVHQIDAQTDSSSRSVPEGDASVTSSPGCVLAILTADCLPVVIADNQATVLGVAHAGWRGLAAGVLDRTVERMRQLRPDAQDFRAWIGPAIGQDSFQVGRDVFDAFVATQPETEKFFKIDYRQSEKWLADLAGLAEHRLRQAGVTNVEQSGLCTVTDSQQRFFSYRRDKNTGRMATIAWLQQK